MALCECKKSNQTLHFSLKRTSIIGNHIEGQSGSSQKDFMNYINTSLKSTEILQIITST